ncbi:VOC family protein [Amycolatopsis sp. FU40]|uniref:VOC family protein n=1 Tax=Amycolatopsis sp. FU40 TaxID=2914159 RepID=UPI001F3B6F16|nr:VOC family protein [Amycolatopsis sp. FU40]UKD51258.1 VOC family protein [Amycolatopsis sp. FU40]
MSLKLGAVIIDAASLEEESTFWHQFLGGSVAATETHHFLSAEGFPTLVIQHAAGQAPPEWPDGASQQVHLDITAADLAAAESRAVEAGARQLSGHVYASPAGHPFCLRQA